MRWDVNIIPQEFATANCDLLQKLLAFFVYFDTIFPPKLC